MSSKESRASRYAQAIIQASLERWRGSLSEAADIITKDSKLAALLNDAGVDVAQKLSALQNVLPGNTPVEIANLLKVLVQEGDLALLPQVTASLVQAVSGQRGPTRVEVIAAVELSNDEQEELRKSLTKQYGEGMAFHFAVDPSLLGGLRVRIGDRLIDTSVASRLAALRESLASAVR
jgi:F-type H+-transporting ATPase subunit delta